MHPQPPSHRHGWAGQYALAAGVAAIVCALLPGVSDVIAAPLAVLAIVLGLLGVRWHQSGRAPRVASAITGTVLGAVALSIVAVMVAASHT